MKFFKYGIMLERLREDDIELVRQWRNSDPVRMNMQYRKIITPEEQLNWFRSIDNLSNNYLMIHYRGEKIGLLNDKNIDWEARTSESGIFFGKTEFYSTFLPYLVSVAGIETTFYLLGWKKQYARILKTNTNAINFNLQLGYRLCDGQEAQELQLYEMTRETFEEKAEKIRSSVRAIAGGENRAMVLFEPDDYRIGLAQKVEEILQGLPHSLLREETPEGVCFRETEGGKPTA